MFIEIFDYQIAENKYLDVHRHRNLNFKLLMKRLTKKSTDAVEFSKDHV